MIKAVWVVLSLYVLTAAIIRGMGVTVSLPWALVVGLGVLPVPFACAAAVGGFYLQGRLSSRPWILRLSGIVLGLVLVALHRFDAPVLLVVWLVSVAVVVWHLVTSRFATIKTFAISFGIIAMGFGVVGNLNFLALKQVTERLRDASLYQSDLAIYGFLFGGPIDYRGTFPLIKSNILFDLFQNAYSMLFFGTFLLIFILVHKKESISHFLCAFFGCYLIGILVFLVYPTVGPCIYYPSSFTPEYRGTVTYQVMQAFISGYQSVKQHSAHFAGVGYFVAFPSLHVAVATVLQYFSRRSQIHFWMLLPISVGLVGSTVFLGYHYFVDVPAGVLLALSVIFLLRLKNRRILHL